MRDEERKKLEKYNSEYLSIGISENGVHYNRLSVPWESTANAFNMKIPDVYISKEDLNDAEIMEALKKYKIIGLYIFVQLDDYAFIKDFPDIWDLNICSGNNIRDLSFLSNLQECRMFYIEDAILPDLKPIVNAKLNPNNKSFFSSAFVCVGLCDCKIDDVSGLDNEKLYFSEFLIWGYGDESEKARYGKIRAGKFNYYSLDK